MKKFTFASLLFLVVLLFSFPVFSQTMFYRSYEISVWDVDEEDNLSNRDSKDIPGVITFEEAAFRLTIDLPEARFFFTILEKFSEESYVDDDGDEYNRLYYRVVDEKGRRCQLIIDDYIKLSDTVFYIKYGDKIFRYLSYFIQHKDDEAPSKPAPSPTNTNTRTTFS